jgi:hypothetical protein
MTDFFETESFLLPSQLKNDVAGRMKGSRGVKSIELHLKGDSLDGAKEFGRMLVALKRRGVRITHEFSIKIEFPRSISRERALDLVGNMPRSKNGSLKVRVELGGKRARE